MEVGSDQSTDQHIENSRTAARVREALAASANYKYDGVKVIASNGVVQLSGFVNTSAQRSRAGEVISKVVGVKDVVNNITVKE
jgi:hyperosmotically inducible protein